MAKHAAAGLGEAEPARVAAVVTVVLQLLVALGVANLTDADMAKVTASTVTALPVVLVAGEWVRRRVWSRRSLRRLHPHAPPQQ